MKTLNLFGELQDINEDNRVYKIMFIVCEYLKMSIADMRKPGRTMKFAEARHFVVWFLHYETKLTPTEIGQHINRDRTCYYNSLDRIRGLKESGDVRTKFVYSELVEKI